MNTAEKIFQEVSYLPDFQAQEVLNFIGYLKNKYIKQSNDRSQISNEFDKFGSVFDGKFNREECYDRKVLR